MKFNKLLFLIIVIVVGAFVTFYSTNLLCSDLSNMFYGVHDMYIVSSIPLFTLTLDIVCFIIFAVRYFVNPQYLKSMGKLYSIYLIVNSVVGIVTAIITGTSIYHSFVAPYPFGGYTLITLILSILLLALGIVLLIKSIRMPDGERKRISLIYIIYNVILGLTLYYTLYTLGSFVWMPVYVQWRTLWLTFPFYMSMLCPMAFAIHVILCRLDLYKTNKARSVTAFVIAIASVVTAFAVIIIGASNPLFISAISPALPIERLATKPVMSLLHGALSVGFGIYFVLHAHYKAKNN